MACANSHEVLCHSQVSLQGSTPSYAPPRCYTTTVERKAGRYELKFCVDGRYVCCGASTVVEVRAESARTAFLSQDGAGHYNNVVDVFDVPEDSPCKTPEKLRVAFCAYDYESDRIVFANTCVTRLCAYVATRLLILRTSPCSCSESKGHRKHVVD